MIYAVGDIHGALAQLERAIRLIEADGGRDARVVFLGDYVDRGPDSAGVLQRLIDGQAEGRDWVCLKGNHDRLFQRFVEDGATHDENIKSGKSWLHEALGGRETLASYGVHGDTPDELREAALGAVPEAHLGFLREMPLWRSEGDLIFAHAGIRPGVPMEDQVEDDLIWIREPFLSDERDHGALVVHGHTVQERPVHCGNRVNLDGGAGYGRLLVPAVFMGREIEILTEKGRWPLRP